MRTLIRFALAVITAPIVVVAYGLLWVFMLAFGAQDNGMFYSNLPLVTVAWITVVTVFPLVVSVTDAIDRWFEHQLNK